MRKVNRRQHDQETKQTIESAKLDTAFRKISKNAIGFYLWKVDGDRAEAVPREQFGKFIDDCTYILYVATTKGGPHVTQETINREIKKPAQLQRFIHFWLGESITPDKSGNAAYKVIELDNFLGNTATLCREAQANESARFLSYFKQGIVILTSKKMETPCCLYEVRGKKCPLCIQKHSIEWQHFNSGQIMLLQTENYIFVWIGRATSITLKRNAVNFAILLSEQLETPLEISIVDDGYEQAMSDAKKREWNQYLCLTQRFVQPVGFVSQQPAANFRLYKCGFNNNKYRIEEVKSSQLEQSDLENGDGTYIVDGGFSRGVWIWVGRLAHVQEKSEAIRNARGFVKKKKYPFQTPVIRVIDGNEPVEFMNLFAKWSEHMEQNGNNKSGHILGKFDVLSLIDRPKIASDTQLIDDGSEKISVYKIFKNNLLEIPKRSRQALFSEDCFLIHYQISVFENNLIAFSSGGKTFVRNILYLWIGNNCDPTSKSSGETLSTELFAELNVDVMLVRVHQGFEPPHFLQIFKGRLIIFQGKSDNFDPTGLCGVQPYSFILKVSGDSTFNTKAVHMASQVTEFSTKNCYIIKPDDNHVWVWCGQSTTGDAREMAKRIGSQIGDYVLALESNEPDGFFESVNEVIQFTVTSDMEVMSSLPDVNRLKVGLFIMSSDQGRILFNQIYGFEQKDLSPEDVFLLDAGRIIYVWLGALSSPDENLIGWDIASQFIESLPNSRDPNTPIALIHQGYEPSTFTGFFEEWDRKLWDSHKSYEMLRYNTESSHSFKTVQPVNLISKGDLIDFDKYLKYPVEILRSEAELLPAGIDPKRKEVHLTHDDFVGLFGMKFTEFEMLPNWRKQELKKGQKLF